MSSTTSRSKIPDKYLEELRLLLHDVPVDEVELRLGTWIGRLFGRLKQYGVTFGRTIHITPRAPLDRWSDARYFGFLAHECYHVKQYTRLGLVPFLLLYGIARIAIFLLRRPIGDHPMEMPAYDIQRLAIDRWETRHPDES